MKPHAIHVHIGRVLVEAGNATEATALQHELRHRLGPAIGRRVAGADGEVPAGPSDRIAAAVAEKLRPLQGNRP